MPPGRSSEKLLADRAAKVICVLGRGCGPLRSVSGKTPKEEKLKSRGRGKTAKARFSHSSGARW